MRIVQTESGKYWPQWEDTGDLVRDGHPHGHDTIESARKKAAEVLSGHTGSDVSPEQIKIGVSCR